MTPRALTVLATILLPWPCGPTDAWNQSAEEWTTARPRVFARLHKTGIALSHATSSLSLGLPRVRRNDGLGSQSNVKAAGPALWVDRGEFIERYSMQGESLHQEWVFAQKPRGTGPLEIRIATSASFVGASSKGLVLEGSGGTFVYGHGTWIDRARARVSLPARHEGGDIVLEVPAEVLERTTWPAVLDPVIEPAFRLTSPQSVPRETPSADPAAATAGGTTLVVWSDVRRTGSGGGDIFGTRLDASGRLLDPFGIPISIWSGAQLHPRVATDGSDFLVAWSDSFSVRCARVTSSGVVRDTAGIDLGPATEAPPSVVFNGTHYVVAWSAAGDVVAKRVSQSGQVLDTNPISIAIGPQGQDLPTAAQVGTSTFLAWQEEQGGRFQVRFTRLSQAGVVLDPGGIAVPPSSLNQTGPSLASDGTGALLVWEAEQPTFSTHDVLGTRLTAQGGVLDAPPLDVAVGPRRQVAPNAGWNGFTYLVAFSDDRTLTTWVSTTRVAQSGAVLDPTGRPAVQSSISFLSSDGALLIWDGLRVSSVDRMGALLNSSGALVAQLGNSQQHAQVAAGAGLSLVVWAEPRATSDVYAARVTATAVLDPVGIPLATGPADELVPTVAWNGTHFLVVWVESRAGTFTLRGNLLTPAGLLVDPSGFAIARSPGSQFAPAASWDGTSFIVAWEDRRSGGSRIYGTRVNPSGVTLDPDGFLIGNAGSAPRIAGSPMGSLVVWPEPGPGAEIFASRVSRSGAVLDVNGLRVGGPGSAVRRQPDVSFGRGSWLVSWLERTGSANFEARGRRVDIAGRILDQTSFIIDSRSGHHDALALEWDGVQWVASFTVSPSPSSQEVDVFAARVSERGAPLDAMAIALADGPGKQAFASGGCRALDCLVVWTADEPSSYSTRLFGTRFATADALMPVGQLLHTLEDTPLSIELALGPARLLDAGVTFMVSAPGTGTLTGTPPRLVYLPRQDSSGHDAFSFQVSDGGAATVDIIIEPVNDPPQTPSFIDAGTLEDLPVTFALAATDPEGDQLSFEVRTRPQRGRLELSDGGCTYTPGPDLNGTDRFTYAAWDGADWSTPTEVVLTIAAVNDAPTATMSNLRAVAGRPLRVTLSGSDIDGDPLSFRIESGPDAGVLTGSPPNLEYTSLPTATGPDGFTFSVSDGVLRSPPTSVLIHLEVPDAGPSAEPPAAPDGPDAGMTAQQQPRGCGVPGGAFSLAALLWLIAAGRRDRHRA